MVCSLFICWPCKQICMISTKRLPNIVTQRIFTFAYVICIIFAQCLPNNCYTMCFLTIMQDRCWYISAAKFTYVILGHDKGLKNELIVDGSWFQSIPNIESLIPNTKYEIQHPKYQIHSLNIFDIFQFCSRARPSSIVSCRAWSPSRYFKTEEMFLVCLWNERLYPLLSS